MIIATYKNIANLVPKVGGQPVEQQNRSVYDIHCVTDSASATSVDRAISALGEQRRIWVNLPAYSQSDLRPSASECHCPVVPLQTDCLTILACLLGNVDQAP